MKNLDILTISIYKGYKRLKVFNIKTKTARIIILTNSILLICFAVFFTGFLYQWSQKTIIKKDKDLLESELAVIRNNRRNDFETCNNQEITKNTSANIASNQTETSQESNDSNKVIKIDAFSYKQEQNKAFIKFNLINNNQSSDLLTGSFVVLGMNGNLMVSYPAIISGDFKNSPLIFSQGEMFSIRAQKTIALELNLPEKTSLKKINIIIHSNNGDEELENRIFTISE